MNIMPRKCLFLYLTQITYNYILFLYLTQPTLLFSTHNTTSIPLPAVLPVGSFVTMTKHCRIIDLYGVKDQPDSDATSAPWRGKLPAIILFFNSYVMLTPKKTLKLSISDSL